MTAFRWVHKNYPEKMLVSFDLDQHHVYTWDKNGIPTKLDRRQVEKEYHLPKQAPFEPAYLT